MEKETETIGPISSGEVSAKAKGRKMPTNAAEWLQFVNTARIWTLVFTAVLAVTTVGLQYAQSRLQDFTGKKKDAELKAFQLESREKSALLEKEAADARLEQERLQKSNLILQQIIEREKAEREKVTKKLSGRTLSQHQILSLRAGLRKPPAPIFIDLCVGYDREASAFALYLIDALEPVAERIDPRRASGAMVLGGVDSGLSITCRDENLLRFVEAAFTSAGLRTHCSLPILTGSGLGSACAHDVNVFIDVKRETPYLYA